MSGTQFEYSSSALFTTPAVFLQIIIVLRLVGV